MNSSGFIVLHRKLLDWEWFKDTNTLVLFVYILLKANFVEGKYFGKKIRRGQLATSLPSLAAGTGLSIQNVRTALKHLISTGEITEKVTGNTGHNYRLITIVKYDEYQDLTGKVTDELAGRQQDANRTLTGRQQQYNNNNNNNKETIKKESVREKPQPKRFIKPTREECMAYANERGNKIDGEYFFDYYEANGWDMQNWKAKMRTWEKREERYKNGPGKAGNAGVHTGTDGAYRPDYSFLRDTIVQV